MASIVNDLNGRRRIQFVASDGSRKAIRLGKIDRKNAESICRHVESLLSAQVGSQPVPRDTAAWLANIGSTLRDKLTAVGLVRELYEASAPTLSSFLNDYIAKKTDIKAASLLAVQQAVRNLLTFFDAARRLDTITAGDAEDFRKWLLNNARSRLANQRHFPQRLLPSGYNELPPFSLTPRSGSSFPEIPSLE